MTTHEQHNDLIADAVGGSRSAVQELLLLYHDRLLARLRRSIPLELQQTVTPEDVCQTAYVDAIRQIRSFRVEGGASFYPWLRHIAEHKLTDAIRGRRAAKRGGGLSPTRLPGDGAGSSAVAALELLGTHSRSPSRSAARREAVQLVQAALDGLKDDYRQAITLRYIDGLPVAEAARRMGRSTGAVSMLCNRALRELEEAMGNGSKYFSSKS